VLAEPDVVIEWLRAGRVIETNDTYRILQTRSWRTSTGYLQVRLFDFSFIDLLL